MLLSKVAAKPTPVEVANDEQSGFPKPKEETATTILKSWLLLTEVNSPIVGSPASNWQPAVLNRQQQLV
jgi:hypothetical protein